MTRKIWQHLQLITQQGLNIIDIMRIIMWIGMATYRGVIALNRIATAPAYSLDLYSFSLEDAIGRVVPVPLLFINSWRAFETAIEETFKDRRGFLRVQKGDYVLQEDGTDREIVRGSDWNSAFMPGQRINMSVIFRQDNGGMTETIPQQGIVECPNCHTATSGSPDKNIQWLVCPSLQSPFISNRHCLKPQMPEIVS